MKQDEFILRPAEAYEEPRYVKEMLGKLPPSRQTISAVKKKAIPSRIDIGMKSPGKDYVWVQSLRKWVHYAFARCHMTPEQFSEDQAKEWEKNKHKYGNSK